MRGLLSLEQELRAARRTAGQKDASGPNRSLDPKETERPWQRDIDQVHQTMREMLRAIASLSGVELPGLPPGLEDNGAPLPRLDIKNLKDRFLNDLEGFSIKTTEELTKRAKERTHAAINAVQDEVGGKIEQVAAEFREQLKRPAQVEILLEPSVKEAAARLERSLSQKVEQLFAEREQLVQEKLQEALRSFQAQISKLEQTVQQIHELKTDSVVQLPAEQPKAAPDNAMKKCESNPNNELEGNLDQTFSRIKSSFSNLLGTSKIRPAKNPIRGLEEQGKAIPFNDMDSESRVQQALEHLGRLGSKNPHPAGKVESLKAIP